MPPKPWQTRKKPLQNISEIIQSNPTIKQQVPKVAATPNGQVSTKMEMQGSVDPNNPNLTTGSMTSGAYGGYGGYGSGYGSSYGGYGSYGSSYGGYGGYGSSYGGMYGSSYGGYGGYGMGMGMGRFGMPGQQPKGFLFNTMVTLESFTYLINCLCQIARSLDQNYQGLSIFYKSFKNLISRMQYGVLDGIKWIFRKIKNFLLGIFQFIVENIFFMKKTNVKAKYKAIKFIMSTAIIVLIVSLYPLIRKGIKNF